MQHQVPGTLLSLTQYNCGQNRWGGPLTSIQIEGGLGLPERSSVTLPQLPLSMEDPLYRLVPYFRLCHTFSGGCLKECGETDTQREPFSLKTVTYLTDEA